MTLFTGSNIGYGSVGNWYDARIEVTQSNISNTVTRVTYSFYTYVTGAISDSNNAAGASGDLTSTTYGTRSYSYGTSGGTKYYVTSATKDFTRGGSDSSKSQTFWIEGLADSIGGGARSTATATFTIPAAVTEPDTPAAPTISSLSSSGAAVGMTLPDNNGSTIVDTGFWVYNVASGGTAVASDGVADTRTSHAFSTLSRATNYWAAVAAKNGVGWSPQSARTAFTTLPEPPTLAGTPAATNIARTSFVVPTATISDTGGQSPSQYRVQVNTSATDVGADVFTQTSWAAITVGSRLPLTTYHYRVAGYNSGGWGDYTAWTTVTTLDAVPDDPAAPTASNITETSIDVAWVAPALNGATLDNYLVRVCTGNDPDAYVKTYTVSSATLSQTVAGLLKATDYNVFVKALATPTDSGWSQPGSFRTAGTNSTLFPWFKVSGTWYQIHVWKNVDGTWREVHVGLNLAGTWKKEVD